MVKEELLKVLLVDDDELIREACTAVLQNASFNVTTAVNGLDALDKLDGNDFSLVIIDVNMPKLDGIDVYKRVFKTRPELRDSFLFITGNKSGELEALGVLLQTDIAVMCKPFNTIDLISKVRNQLGCLDRQSA